MKKNKILFPILGLAASVAAIAPIVSLTSCSKNDKVEKANFTFASEIATKAITVNKPDIVGQVVYTFVTTETLSEQEIKSLSTTVELTQTNSNISILRCWKESFDTEEHKLTVRISYSINPAAFTAKADSVVKYDVRIEGGTWYQTEKEFSITAKKAA